MTTTFIGKNGFVMNRDGPRFKKGRGRRRYTKKESNIFLNSDEMRRKFRKFVLGIRVEEMTRRNARK